MLNASRECSCLLLQPRGRLGGLESCQGREKKNVGKVSLLKRRGESRRGIEEKKEAQRDVWKTRHEENLGRLTGKKERNGMLIC